ncbi:RrF2 family transcriptional regulator [Guptibacillus algicola]|uniref:RrF2 family transcriptional regulator n=1 Tax=Guptibacillus algicola TaxID=225844 RepID=UPI001CD6CE40|nr:Rrf2 family transcriptional regulator [Alkalihalobacillus algicola]MCA0986737.1 Rrf2 family transcriptional regulator [Alkalihalobacillus algicola]
MNSDFTLAVHSLALLAIKPGQMSTSDYLAGSASVHPVRMRKILSLLKKNGYIVSKEGAGGGFTLACKVEDVTLDKIYSLTSIGSLKPKCPDANQYCLVGANLSEVLGDIFTDAEDHLTSFLKKYTIRDIIQSLKQKQF